MAVIHIPEEEAAKAFGAALKTVRLGDSVIIEGPGCELEFTVTKGRGHTVAEAIEILKNLPGERGIMDEDFARDVRIFRERHRGESLGAKWE